MSPVSSPLNPAVANLLQTLGAQNSPVLRSQAVVSALQSAPPADVVQLSVQAVRLQSVNTLFGISSPESSDANNTLTLFGIPSVTPSGASNMLQALQNAGATLTPAEQAAARQSQVTLGLFGLPTAYLGTSFSIFG